MIEGIIGLGSVLAWTVLGNIVWVLVARREFDPACWLIWPLMLILDRRVK